MHVALTGVSGFIGSTIAQHLHAAGHTVTGLVRATSRREHIEPWVERFVVGDQADRTAWPALLEGADAVIHNSVDWRAFKVPVDLRGHLESNLLASIELLHAAAPRQFVFMSTIAVHHDMRPRWAGEIDEDHPLRPATLYGAAKAAVETHLWERHFAAGHHTCALRPCAVYGIDPTLKRSIGYPIVAAAQRGEPYLRAGGGKFVHVDDVARATVATLGNPVAAGRAFNLVDCYARWSDWARMIGERLGVEIEVDRTSPAAPKNTFACDAARQLGVPLDRGFEGIAAHADELIAAMANPR